MVACDVDVKARGRKSPHLVACVRKGKQLNVRIGRVDDRALSSRGANIANQLLDRRIEGAGEASRCGKREKVHAVCRATRIPEYALLGERAQDGAGADLLLRQPALPLRKVVAKQSK